MGLDMVIFWNITSRQLLYGCCAVLAAIIFFKLIKKLFFKKRDELKDAVYRVCNKCGWQGYINKLDTRCPKCSQTFIEE